MDDMLEQLAGYIGWKDESFCFIGCNNDQAQFLRLKTPQDIIGLQDIDLIDQTQASAAFHRKHDELALKGCIIKTIHPSTIATDQKTYFQIKKPLKTRYDQINGIIYHCHEFIHPYLFLNLQFIDQNHCPKALLSLYYELEPTLANNPFCLSNRELECVFCLLRGMSAKKTGECLGLSKRTIEFYIENIKSKLNCHTKAEVLDLALNSGYLNFIPSCFLYQNIKVVIS